METIKCKVRDLYELRGLLDGFVIFTPGATPEAEQTRQVIYPGILHEKGVPESTKRAAYKAVRVITAEIEPIDIQRNNLKTYTEEGKTEEELKLIQLAKDKEILDEEVEFQTEKLDFAKIENLSFQIDYGFLYETLFK